MLAYPRPECQFILDTDACDIGIGAVLSQLIEGDERVIAYASRSLSKPERRYCVTRKELLAVVHFIKHFRHFLYGSHFVIRTDHGSLRWLYNFKEPEGQIARWLETLSMYDFEIRHRPGRLHKNADALSRRPCNQCGTEAGSSPLQLMVLTRAQTEAEKFSEASDHDNSGAVWIASIGNAQISQEQREDSIIGPILKWKSEGRRPNWSKVVSMSAACKTYWSMWHQLEVKQGVLYKRWDEEISGKANWQLVVPQCRRQEILEMVYDHSTGGHLGEHKTLANVRARFYWYGHRRDVHKWCSSCEVCGSRKGPNKKNRGKMGHVKAGFPMERVALDIMGPLPRSDRGNRYLLVLSDYFTKWVEAYSIPNQEATTIARKVVEEFICRFGVPLAIHTDQGRQFESALFREMCHLLDIDKTRTTAFHPQSGGLVERMNRTLENMLSMFVSEHQRDWDHYIQFLLLAYRSTTQESTNASPNLLMLGREVFLPVDVIFGRPPGQELEAEEYIQDLQHRLEVAHEYVRAKLQKASQRQKRYYDRKAHGKLFEAGDVVWLFEAGRKPGICPKLQINWKGPYTVLQQINNLLYRIQRSPRSKPKIVHFDRLKEYNKRDLSGENSTRALPITNEQDSVNSQPVSSSDSSDEDENVMREPRQGFHGVEEISSGMSAGEGALQYTHEGSGFNCPGTSGSVTGSGLNCPGTSGSVTGSGLNCPGTSGSVTGSGLTGPGTSGLQPGCGLEYPEIPNEQGDDPVTVANVVSSPDIVKTEDAACCFSQDQSSETFQTDSPSPPRPRRSTRPHRPPDRLQYN